MDRKNELLLRVYFVLLVFIFFSVVILWKIVRINVIEGDKWRSRAEQNLKWKPVDADRGDIFTESGQLLATSITFFDIHMDLLSPNEADFMQNIDSLSYLLSKYTPNKLTPGQWKKALISNRKAGQQWSKPGTRYFPIAKSLNYLELQRFKQFPLFRKGQFGGGFIVEKRSTRSKPFGELAARTIGEDRQNADKIGLEGFFDKQLKGDTDQKLMKKIAPSVWVPVYDPSEFRAKKGKDLVTTIDIHMQDIVHHELLRALEYHRAKGGTAIVMEVETGAIKAMSNLKRTSDGTFNEVYNYAIGERSEPGSTFKLASLLAMLESGNADLDTKVDLHNGVKKFHDLTMHDSEWHGMRETDLLTAFAKSSNVGIASLTEQIFGQDIDGEKAYVEYLKSFRLDRNTGIEIEGEKAPQIKDPVENKNQWYGTTIPWMSHGYELTQTPLQTLVFYNAVANGGKMMKPYLVSQIWQDGQKEKDVKPLVLKEQIASPANILKARHALEEVVLSGTARSLKTDQYTFAGKTGTARFDYGKNREEKKYNASFAAYFPADKPKYSVMIMVYEPKEHGFYGGSVAGPVFRAIADQFYLTIKDFMKPYNIDEKPSLASYQKPGYDIGYRGDFEKILNFIDLNYHEGTNGNWAVINPNDSSLLLEKRSIKKGSVPNVQGMGLRDAIYVLENLGLRVRTAGYGKVTSQSLSPGVKIEGQTIELTLN